MVLNLKFGVVWGRGTLIPNSQYVSRFLFFRPKLYFLRGWVLFFKWYDLVILLFFDQKYEIEVSASIFLRQSKNLRPFSCDHYKKNTAFANIKAKIWRWKIRPKKNMSSRGMKWPKSFSLDFFHVGWRLFGVTLLCLKPQVCVLFAARKAYKNTFKPLEYTLLRGHE